MTGSLGMGQQRINNAKSIEVLGRTNGTDGLIIVPFNDADNWNVNAITIYNNQAKTVENLSITRAGVVKIKGALILAGTGSPECVATAPVWSISLEQMAPQRQHWLGRKIRRMNMLKECVVLNGQVINIGPWDYQIQPVQVGEREVQPAEYDETGTLIKEAVMEPIYEDQVTNPLPLGAAVETRDVIQNVDGGWCLADDYAALRQAAYPPYSPFDIIDEILKVVTPSPGSKLEQIVTERNAVKTKYPKPTV